MKLLLLPEFGERDEGDGGIRRVVEAQRKYLPLHGFEFVDSIEQADIVATHTGGIATVPVNKPFIMHTHGLYWTEYRWDAWCHKLNQIVVNGMKEADVVTVPSDWVGNAVKRGMWTRPVTLHHGVNVEEWTPTNTGGQYVLWNKSRPDPVCDEKVVDALALRMPHREFLSTFGRRDLANLKITGRVPYMHAKEQVHNAGVYLATARETFGIGTIEAMAAGVPVVGWAWGGQREFIEHGVNGWLARPHDFDGLIEGIEWAFENHDRIAREARLTVEDNFQWKDKIADYAELYEHAWDMKADAYHRPTVSVIVPAYNLGRFLPDTIRSVKAQSFQDWEMIIVDDCSTDSDVYEIAKQAAASDPRIKAYRTPENLYLAGALNYGFNLSTGRHILPLDADNMIEPYTLSELVRALEGSRKVDIAYGGVRFVLEDGTTPDASVGTAGISGWPLAFDYRSQMIQRNQIPSTSLIRRRAIETSGGWRTRCHTAEDAENWTRLASLGFTPKKVTNAPTLIYRQRSDSMSRVQEKWDFNSWYCWARDFALTPFAAAGAPPKELNGGAAWSVPSCEPVGISVIIPVGPGHKKLVMDAIDSVVAQSFQSWEVIMVDDSGEPWPAGQPKPPSWVNIIMGGRIGPAAARNKGVKVARGRYILPLDADDYLQPEAMAQMIQVVQEEKGFVYSQWWDDFGDKRDVYDPPEYNASLLLSKGAIHAVTGLYSKKDWEDVGGMDEGLTHWEDWDFQIRLADRGICGTKITAPLFTYRKTTGSRRESNYAAFDEGKKAMMERWGDLWEGVRTMAGCTGCPGGGGRRTVAPPTPTYNPATAGRRQQVNQEPGVTLIEYIGNMAGTNDYVGKGTGRRYRFGANASHQKRYVYNEDVPGLLALKPGGVNAFAVVSTPEDLRPAPSNGASGEATPDIVAVGSPNTSAAMKEEFGASPVQVFNDSVVAEQPRTDAGQDDQPEIVNEGIGMSIREMKVLIPDMTLDEVMEHMLSEQASTKPRATALELLQRRKKELMA